MNSFNTLLEVASARRDSEQSVHYLEADRNQRVVRLPELYDRACGLLYHLQSMGARAASELIIYVDSNEQFLDAFWACILGRITAVPLAPGINDEQRLKLFRVLRRLEHPHICTDEKTWRRLAAFAKANNLDAELARVRPTTLFLDQVDDISREGRLALCAPDDIAFVQYSSGSTSEPKGVALTHRNLLTNIAAIIAGAAIGKHDKTLSWMPLTHDMGLIGFHLTPLVADIPQYLMPTSLFVRRPQLWLEKASELRATLLCSPNFGYRHFLRNHNPARTADLDLSAVRVLFNGAEPISVDLARQFLDEAGKAGLQRTAMFPVYGLAEASLAVAFPKPGAALATLSVDRDALGPGARAAPVPAGHPRAVTLPSVGHPVAGCEVCIGDDAGQPVPAGTVGRILIRGANVTHGYYRDPNTTSATISSSGWLDTGDVGFLDGQGLYVTGRLKDIIFVNGQNYYPQDIEAVLDQKGLAELGKVAACGVRPREEQAEELAIFIMHRGSIEEFAPIARRIRTCVNEHIGIPASHVLPVNRIAKTTSGKIQRYLLAAEFEAGALASIERDLGVLLQSAPSNSPASAIEASLKEICDAVLEDQPIGVNDNIFEVGTSSLMLAQIYQRIETIYPGKIEVTDFFDYPTIAELARYLEKRLAAA